MLGGWLSRLADVTIGSHNTEALLMYVTNTLLLITTGLLTLRFYRPAHLGSSRCPIEARYPR